VISWFGSADDEESLASLARMEPPPNELPVPVALVAVLARTDDVAVGLVGVRAYSTGVLLDLVVRLRRPVTDGPPLHELVSGGGYPGLAVGGRLLFGVETADGRTASTASLGDAFTADPDSLLLVDRGQGGDETSYDQSYWLTPLPLPGPLTLALLCEGLGIPETTLVVDATPIAAAGAQAVELWPRQPPETYEPPPQPPPEVPEGGWFARHLETAQQQPPPD
jgi:hypothetical protein